MAHSSEFYAFTTHLHSNLRNRLLGSAAIEIEPGSKVGSGLLNTRMDNDDKLFRPRLIGVSGRLARAVGRILQRDTPDDLFVVGATRDDDPAATIGRLFAFCPGVAQNILGGNGENGNRELDDNEVVMFNHSALLLEPEELSPAQAALYYQRIDEKIAEIKQQSTTSPF